MRIQHNIPALNSYRNYTNNTSKLAKNLEKLSTGYKINRAGDDAAGLAISEKMRVQIAGLEQAQGNAKAGINLVQTAEGALTEVHDMLNRMYTLAEQSANGTYDNETDRAQLQKEVDQLRTEIDRIADSSNYNGIKLLDGSLTSNGKVNSFKNVAISSAAATATGDSVTPFVVWRDGSDAKTPSNGKYELDFSDVSWTNQSTGATNFTMSFGNITVTATVQGNATLTGDKVAQAFADFCNSGGATTTFGDISVATTNAAAISNGYFAVAGKELTVSNSGGVLTFEGVTDLALATSPDTSVTYGGGTNLVNNVTGDAMQGNQAGPQGWSVLEEAVSSAGTEYAQATLNLGEMNISDGTTIKIGDTQYVFAVGKNSNFKDAANVVDMTDFESLTSNEAKTLLASRFTGVANDNKYVQVETATHTGIGSVRLTERANGVAREEGYDMVGSANGSTAAAADRDASWANAAGQRLIQFGQAVRTGSALTLQIGDTADSYNKMGVDISDMHADAMGIGSIDISTQEGASTAMKAIKNAVNYVSDVRGGLGAMQNRLDHTINNLGVMQENIQDAESYIRDTDVAKEMMAYTKNNILVQSAQAMLAQANQLPQGVLQLLG